MKRTVVVAGVIVTGLVLAGCASGEKESDSTISPTTTTSAAATTTSPAPTTTAQAGGPAYTLGDYFKDNSIATTPVKRDTPGAPQLNLPLPPGWVDMDADAPADAWGAIAFVDPETPDDPAAIVARMVRLDGPADPAKILELAPNAVRNLPEYQGPATGNPSTLGGFDAVEIAGTAVQDGKTLFIARKTVVIPGQDGTYVLALDAQGPEAQQEAIGQAMQAIDAETTIQP